MAVRKFGVDKPTTLDFSIKGSKEVYHLPVASELPLDLRMQLAESSTLKGDERELAAQAFEYNFLTRYVDEDVVKDMPFSLVQEIFKAWTEVSAEAGAEPGE